MHLFIGTKIENDRLLLGEDETYHCIKSLRFKQGDTIYVTTGDGFIYEGQIVEHSKKQVILQTSDKTLQPKCPYQLHIAVAPTKNRARIEQFIEKAVEVGIQKISFIQCNHSEKRKINLERMEKIARSASKQSIKAYFTELAGPLSFNKFVDQCNSAQKYIAHCKTSEVHRMTHYKNFNDCTILIGPEGDFSQDEIDYALQNGFEPLNFGEERLRTETAALFATFFVNIVHK
jgi:16S rRNA (uracil1498-N3)-methyltransferase